MGTRGCGWTFTDSVAVQPLGGNDANDEVADVHTVVFSDDGSLGNSSTIDVRPVGAVQVSNNEAPLAVKDPGVSLRDVSLGKNEVVPLDAPQGDFITSERLTTLSSTLLRDE